MSSPQTFVFIGQSGCGKGTQAALLLDYLGVHDLKRKVFFHETGKLIREFLKDKSYSARLAREIAEQGGLQPEFLSTWMWANHLIKDLKDDEHIVLDGSPRKVHEAEILDSAFRFYRREHPRVVYLAISDDEARQRLEGRARPDDNPEDIDERLRWFHTHVEPTIEWYRANPRYELLEIEGGESPQKVWKEIEKNLRTL